MDWAGVEKMNPALWPPPGRDVGGSAGGLKAESDELEKAAAEDSGLGRNAWKGGGGSLMLIANPNSRLMFSILSKFQVPSSKFQYSLWSWPELVGTGEHGAYRIHDPDQLLFCASCQSSRHYQLALTGGGGLHECVKSPEHARLMAYGL